MNMSIYDDLEDDYDNGGASEEDLEDDFWEVTHGDMKGAECENPEPFVTLIWSETLRKVVNEPPPLPDSDGPAVGARRQMVAPDSDGPAVDARRQMVAPVSDGPCRLP